MAYVKKGRKQSGDGTPCPNCGSTNTVKNGTVMTKSHGKLLRRRCKACNVPWYPKKLKNTCKCGLIGCTCGGKPGKLITWADGLNAADLVLHSPKYGKATLEHWSV